MGAHEDHLGVAQLTGPMHWVGAANEDAHG